MSATGQGTPAAAPAALPDAAGVHSSNVTASEWGAATSAAECLQDDDGDVVTRTLSDLNTGSFTRKQHQQEAQHQHGAQHSSSQASSRHRASVQAGRGSSQLAPRNPNSNNNTLEGQQRRSSHEGRGRKPSKKKPQSQQQQPQQVPLGQSLREKWQSRWDRRVEAQAAAKARAAALAEQQAQLEAAAAEEEEDEQLPTGASTAAARRSSYGGSGGEQLQLQLQAVDPWVRGLAAWAQECPELIQLQLLDNIPVPEAYQLPDGHWKDKHPPTGTDGPQQPAAQPQQSGAAVCRNSTQQMQKIPATFPASTDGGKSLPKQGQQQKDEQQDLKPLEKPVDFVAELAQAVAAVQGLVDASAAAACCGLSVPVGDTQAVLQEGWRVVQEVDCELDSYEKFTKWVPKRAQNVSLQAVLQLLQVAAQHAPHEHCNVCEGGEAVAA